MSDYIRLVLPIGCADGTRPTFSLESYFPCRIKPTDGKHINTDGIRSVIPNLWGVDRINLCHSSRSEEVAVVDLVTIILDTAKQFDDFIMALWTLGFDWPREPEVVPA